MPGNYRSGAPRKPTALKLLQGSRVRNREQEPQYEPGIPDCPARLQEDPEAKSHWDLLSSRLQASGVLTKGHGEALAMLAEALADYGRARAQLKAMRFQQLIVEEKYDPTGAKLLYRRVKENPLIRRSERLAVLCSRLLGEFGLTPITQAKINSAKPPTETDPFEVFLGGARPR